MVYGADETLQVKWDVVNDRRLLLFGMGREILKSDYGMIAESFPGMQDL